LGHVSGYVSRVRGATSTFHQGELISH